VADKVRRAGLPHDYPHTALYATAMAGFQIARFDRPDHGGDRPMDISPERQQRCNQLFFDPILRALAGGMAGVALRFRTRFESFAQDQDGVTARVVDLDSGNAETIRARYLVACCGGRSPVREALGIELGDGSALGYPMSIFFRAPDMWSHHDKGRTALNFIVGPEGVWATLIPVDGVELWRITLHGGTDFSTPTRWMPTPSSAGWWAPSWISR
jgi:2-polyprenyl-6-methoxyphenol hydroxylase-like FAD-dependent oxidoreductase